MVRTYTILSSNKIRLLENKREQKIPWTDELGTPYLTYCEKCQTAKPNPKDQYQPWICQSCTKATKKTITIQLKLF